MADIKTIPFGKQSAEIIKGLPEGHTGRGQLHLIVTDEAARHEADINAYLNEYTKKDDFMVLDLCMTSDAKRYKQLWTHYNKVIDASVVRDLFMLVDRYIVVGSLTSFDFRDVLAISDVATSLGSCRSDMGIAGLSSLNVYKGTNNIVVGIGFDNPQEATMEEMNQLGDFLNSFECLDTNKWFISSLHGKELIIIYSTAS